MILFNRLIPAIEETLAAAEVLVDATAHKEALSPEEIRLRRAIAALREAMKGVS